MKEKILAMIRQVREDRKKAINDAYLAGCIHPKDAADAHMYDYTILILRKLLK